MCITFIFLAGNCRIVNHVPDASKNMFKSLTACANAPNGQCFAPGRLNISYECHGSHFGCIEKVTPLLLLSRVDELFLTSDVVFVQTTTADGNVTFASIDECEEKCRIVPSGYSLGCAGSRPSTCVMLRQPMSNSTDQYFNGIEACSRYCNQV